MFSSLNAGYAYKYKYYFFVSEKTTVCLERTCLFSGLKAAISQSAGDLWSLHSSVY